MWLVLLWLVIAAAAAGLAVLLYDWLATIIVGALVVVAAFWVLGCIFTPAVPNRRCPKCGGEGLVKLRKGEPAGVRCELCGHVDPEMHVAYLDEW